MSTANKKKSSNPSQPGNRSTASKANNHRTILHQFVRVFNSLNWKGRLLFACLPLIACFLIVFICTGGTKTPEETTEPTPYYIFQDGEGTPIDWQALTAAWATEAGFEKRYNLTDAERWEIASVITAEADGEPFAGKVAVAQCILQACEDDGTRPAEALKKYGYCKYRPEPSKEAMKAVQAVFDHGYIATSEPIKYFYAPARCVSEWHESQVYVMTINGHKFFKEATE